MAIIPCGIVVREPTTAVDLLTWVYRDQKAELMSGRGLASPDQPLRATCGPGMWPEDRCAVFARLAKLGHWARGTGHLQRPALHPDAEAVHDAVIRLSRGDPAGAQLLCSYGRLGEMPEAGDEVPRPGAVHRRSGNNRRNIVEDAVLRGEGGEESGPCCPLRYRPSPDLLAELRGEYRAWWQALARLKAILPPLRRWQVTGLGAPEIPPGRDGLHAAQPAGRNQPNQGDSPIAVRNGCISSLTR